MDTASSTRKMGIWCTVGALVATVGAAVTATISSSVPADQLSHPYSPDVFRITEIAWTVSHVLMWLGTLGLARTGVAGTSRVGRVGIRVALVGMGLIVPAEIGFAFFAESSIESGPVVALDTLIGVATLLAAIGFTVAGVAVLRGRAWEGWQRFTPLLCGLTVFFVFLPILVVSPDDFLWGVAAWSACFIPLGFAVAQHDLVRQHHARGAAQIQA